MARSACVERDFLQGLVHVKLRGRTLAARTGCRERQPRRQSGAWCYHEGRRRPPKTSLRALKLAARALDLPRPLL